MTHLSTTIEVGGVAVDFHLELLPNGQTRCRVWDTEFSDRIDEWPDVGHGTQARMVANRFIYELERKLDRGFVVQMYEVGQAYGGPEEGGWWYSVGEPRDHWFRTTLAEASALKQELEEVYNEDRTTETDFHLAIRFDQDLKGWPERRPYYC